MLLSTPFSALGAPIEVIVFHQILGCRVTLTLKWLLMKISSHRKQALLTLETCKELLVAVLALRFLAADIPASCTK